MSSPKLQVAVAGLGRMGKESIDSYLLRQYIIDLC